MFKIGDKVRLKRDAVVDKRYGEGSRSITLQDSMFADAKDKTFTIAHVRTNRAGVVDNFHLEGSGYIWHVDMFEYAPDESDILIETYGSTVVAKRVRDGRVVKSGVAKCCPEDAFDQYEGAKLALDRLFDKVPQYQKPRVKVEKPVKGNPFDSLSMLGAFPRMFGAGDGSVCDLISMLEGMIKITSDCEKEEESPKTTYSVGDKVRIVSKWGAGCGKRNPEGKMDKYLGTIMTVKEIKTYGADDYAYYMEEDASDRIDCGRKYGWSWYPNMIECLAPKYEKKARYAVGDKVRIVPKWNYSTNHNRMGRMDKHLDTVMTVKYVDSDGDCRMIEDARENDGTGWCWNRHCIMGIETPVYREVNRAAKVGEYIKITNMSHVADETYKNGDIGKVERLHSTFRSDVFAFGGQWVECHEYVVLEGYSK